MNQRQYEMDLDGSFEINRLDDSDDDFLLTAKKDMQMAGLENEWLSKTKTINLNNRQDLDLLKSLNQIVKAYQIMRVPQNREKYLKIMRLRSFASQYMNTHAAEKDGHIYPFLLFSVQENNNEGNEIGQSRMIELNFVEDVLIDRLKDHHQASYHISMVEKVIKGFKYDEFTIEFQNDEKPQSYYATFPL